MALGKYFFWFTSFLIIIILPLCSYSQMRPQDLGKDYLVKLVMKDSSQFYGVVLQKPVPDRIIFQTRYGRLEIPLRDIDVAIDYRFNFVMRDDIKKTAAANAIDAEKNKLARYLTQSKLETISTVRTESLEVFNGYRYLFDDSAHVILATDWGDLFFTFPEIDYIKNYSGTGDKRDEFRTTAYLAIKDPRAWQGYITPNAIPYGQGQGSLTDYLVASLLFGYGATDWLSLNLGGAFIPFLPNTVKIATGGLKVTPLSTKEWNISAGGQVVYSEVVKQSEVFFPYAVATYGDWESNLSILGGVSFKHDKDTNGLEYKTQNTVLVFEGQHRVGQNLKMIGELFFIEGFDIVPLSLTLRYFENKYTIDVGVVFSLFKSGAVENTQTIGEIIFGVSDFPVVPVISASYHF